MGLETGTYISDLVATNPLGSDLKSTADDHLRLIKSTIKTTFPNVNGAVNPTPTEFNYLVGVTSGIQAQIAAKGAITGQTWTGSHNFTGATITATTQAAADNSAKVATTAYADAAKSIGDWVRISTASASASATIDFTGISSTYDMYMVEMMNVIPATNGVALQMRTSANNGVSYDSGASDYVGFTSHQRFTSPATVNGGGAYILLSDAILNTREGFSGFIYITTPSAAARCHIRSFGSCTSSTPQESLAIVGAYRDAASAVNAIRFFMNSGNITSGTFNLYGRKKT